MWMIPQLTGPLMSICVENQYTPAETFPPFQSKIPLMNGTVNLASNVIKCHAPSRLNLGEPSHMHIHLTMDHDSTQLNTPPRVGNMEYSPTWTSPTSMV